MQKRLCLFVSFISFFYSISFLSACTSAKQNQEANGNDINNQSSFSWVKTDTSVALKKASHIIWQFNFNKEADKPFFYPLRTANSGVEMVSYRPADHPWHRGLWFSWKLINGVNYWEEDFESRLSDGRSKINDVNLQLNKDNSAQIQLQIHYAPANGKDVLVESRSLFVSAPDEMGNYYIDWDMKFKALTDTVVFDRTLPAKMGGPFYGGYAGLSYRATQQLKNHTYTDATGEQFSGDVVGIGKSATWMDLSGVTDTSSGTKSGVAIFDATTNTNNPTPWYIYNDKDFAFINASLLFNQKLTLMPMREMKLKYRVFIHEGVLNKTELNKAYEKYVNTIK